MLKDLTSRSGFLFGTKSKWFDFIFQGQFVFVLADVDFLFKLSTENSQISVYKVEHRERLLSLLFELDPDVHKRRQSNHPVYLKWIHQHHHKSLSDRELYDALAVQWDDAMFATITNISDEIILDVIHHKDDKYFQQFCFQFQRFLPYSPVGNLLAYRLIIPIKFLI